MTSRSYDQIADEWLAAAGTEERQILSDRSAPGGEVRIQVLSDRFGRLRPIGTGYGATHAEALLAAVKEAVSDPDTDFLESA